jgi:hypothetical protein
MKKKCKVCGKNADSDYCFQHKPRKSLSKATKTLNKLQNDYNKSVIKVYEQIDKIEKRNQFFLEIWKKRRHYSEVSGTYLGKEPLSTYFHHILPKSKYPQAEFDEENIVLLTLDEHTNVENNMYKYDNINQRRELLLTKYTLK